MEEELYDKPYYAASKAIASAKLSSIEHDFLQCFLLSAESHNDAGRYVLQRLAENFHCTAEETLRSIREDVEALVMKMTCENDIAVEIDAALRAREGNRCCVTGQDVNVKPTHIVAPSIIHDADLLPGGRLRLLLEVFLTNHTIKELFTLLGARGNQNELKNLWLMSSSVYDVFHYGHMYIVKNGHIEDTKSRVTAESLGDHAWWIVLTSPGEYKRTELGANPKFHKMPSTTDPDGLPLPAELLLITHKRVGKLQHTLYIEKQIQMGWPPIDQGPRTLGTVSRLLLRGMLSVLPAAFRRYLYKSLNALVDYWDPNQTNCYIKFLPLGLCLKFGEHTENEAKALLLVEKHTTVNSPKLIDSVLLNGDCGVILMTRIFGDSLQAVLHRMTYEEQEQLGKDLWDWIAQLRRIPNNTNHLIASITGGPIVDHRFEENKWGPFDSMEDWTDEFTSRVVGIDRLRHERPINLLYEKEYDACFTQSDLHLSNIFVRQGRLHGLIDFEHAGFKPEYWEYIRVLWSNSGAGKRRYVYDCAFGKRYEEEYEADIFIRQRSPFFWDD